MKVLRDSDSEWVRRLPDEAKVLMALSLEEHGRIPRVEPDGCFRFEICNPPQILHCLVMEFIEGQDLDQWLKQRRNQPISEDLAQDWLQQIAAILVRVHRQRIVHRDIKPSNIMLRHGQLVLIDFGIVRVEGRGLTNCGTGGYMAPEQAQGLPATELSDFHALGRTFAHLLTGQHPNDLEYHPTGQLKWPDSAPQISQKLKQLIDDLMAPLPQNRPESAQIIFLRLAQLPLMEQELAERTERGHNRIIQRLYKPFLLFLISLILPWLLSIVLNNEFIPSSWRNIPDNHWKAQYFDNLYLEPMDSPMFVEDLGEGSKPLRCDWKEGKPNKKTPKDQFSALITTKRYFDPGWHIIRAEADDGVLVKIEGKTKVDKWVNQDVNNLYCNYFNSEGREYSVTVEYRENDGSARLRLDIQPYKSFEKSPAFSKCKFEERVSNSIKTTSALRSASSSATTQLKVFDGNSWHQIL
jgi:serine/threonine protein kinase